MEFGGEASPLSPHWMKPCLCTFSLLLHQSLLNLSDGCNNDYQDNNEQEHSGDPTKGNHYMNVTSVLM